MTPQRYDLKEWWSKVTKGPYEKFIPWSGITKWANFGPDPELNDQVIFQLFNVEAIYSNWTKFIGLNGRNSSTPDEIDRYDFIHPNVENEFRLTSKFINSNRCERLATIEEKYEKYHNDLNVALYGNEEQFNVENAKILDQGSIFTKEAFYYTKETCETNERRHEWS